MGMMSRNSCNRSCLFILQGYSNTLQLSCIGSAMCLAGLLCNLWQIDVSVTVGGAHPNVNLLSAHKVRLSALYMFAQRRDCACIWHLALAFATAVGAG